MPRAVLVALVSALVFGGCAGARPAAPPAPTVVRGTLATSTGEALPAGTRLMVRLLDVSRGDAPAVTLAEVRLEATGEAAPLAFALAVDPARLDERRRYVVRAEGRDETGALRWTADTATPVPAGRLDGASVALRVVDVRPPPPAPAPPPPEPRRARTVAFDCADAPDAPFRFTVWTRDDEATVWLPARFGGGSALLDRVETASGARYEGDRVVVWTQGDEARLEVRGSTYTGCRRVG